MLCRASHKVNENQQAQDSGKTAKCSKNTSDHENNLENYQGIEKRMLGLVRH